MVVDTSAILAILEGEPEAELFARLIEAADVRLLSAVSLLEAGIVLESRKGPRGADALNALVRESALEIVSFDEVQAELARHAYQCYGRGHHPADLNFGDCASYALAKWKGESLLFKGNDFSQTDLNAASPS